MVCSILQRKLHFGWPKWTIFKRFEWWCCCCVVSSEIGTRLFHWWAFNNEKCPIPSFWKNLLYFFTESWFSKIKVEVGTNWRLKGYTFSVFFCKPLNSMSVLFWCAVSNLKKVIESILDYYIEVLNFTLNEYIRPNAMKIVEHNDQNELGRLLQLILGKSN